MRANVEHERKLEAPAGWQLPDLGGDELEPRVFTSVYHDTPTRSLARSGITLRRRVERGLSVWQLKLPRADARLEVEEPGGPLPPEAVRALLHAHVRHGSLAPVAELRTRRQGSLVAHGNGTAEVTLDEVRVMDAQRVVAAFSEIEVELKEGSPRALAAIAKKLQKAGAHTLGLTPKLLRVLPLPERAQESTPFAIFRARLREQLDQILANDPGVRLGGDDENVHKLRVATRRARALLRTAQPLYTGDVELLTAELKWLGGVLGEARDLDVMIAHLHTQAKALASVDADAALSLLYTLERTRSRTHDELVETLESARYAALLDRYEDVLGTLRPSGEPTSLSSLARRELKKLNRHARRAGDGAEDEQLHDLRKRSKRVRYAYELSGDGKLADRAKHLQDVLGEHQDSVVAEACLRTLAADAPADQAVAGGLLIALEQQRRRAARAAWQRAWKRLAHA